MSGSCKGPAKPLTASIYQAVHFADRRESELRVGHGLTQTAHPTHGLRLAGSFRRIVQVPRLA